MNMELKCMILNVTKFAKWGLIHASDFQILTRHNFICKQATYKAEIFSPISTMIGKVCYQIAKL